MDRKDNSNEENRLAPLQTFRNDQNDIAISLNSVHDQPTDLVIKVTDNVICVKGCARERSDYGDGVQRSFTSPPDSAQESRAGIFRAIARCHAFNTILSNNSLRPSASDNTQDVEMEEEPLEPSEDTSMMMEIEDESSSSD